MGLDVESHSILEYFKCGISHPPNVQFHWLNRHAEAKLEVDQALRALIAFRACQTTEYMYVIRPDGDAHLPLLKVGHFALPVETGPFRCLSFMRVA